MPDALNEIMAVFELALLGQVHVPLWLPADVTVLSAKMEMSPDTALFRTVYPEIFTADVPAKRIVSAAMIRSFELVVVMVGVLWLVPKITELLPAT